MPQNSYAISLMIGNPNKDKVCKIYIRVRVDGKEFRIPTKVKVSPKQFNGVEVIRHNLKNDHNEILRQEKLRVEEIIIKAAARGIPPVFISDKSERIQDFAKKFTDAIKNAETKKSRKSAYKKLANSELANITDGYLPAHERKLFSEGLDHNTVHYNMVRVKTLLYAAIKKGLIESPFVIQAIHNYSPPKLIDKIPEYLTVDEMNSFMNVTRNLGNENKKTSGYYFMLSCLTGYRLSDLTSFDHDKRLKAGMITLRASKNNKIVSIPVYKLLSEVLEYCKDHALKITEQQFRLKVKEIASDIGIDGNRRNIKVHTGRHTFAMMLIDKGFSIDEVSEMLGDSRDVARIYARINNKHLAKKIIERMNG